MNRNKLTTHFRKILNRVLPFLYRIYSSKTRSYSYENLKIKIFPGVFPPRFFYSTQLLISYISGLQLTGQTLLELGCGSGLISLVAARKGARVSASDINPAAVANASFNAEQNNLPILAVESDLFENIDRQTFDRIIINPPFYPGKVNSAADYAWFCGENFDYFRRLFKSLPGFINEKSCILMVLSDTAPLSEILRIAAENNFSFTSVLTEHYYFEKCIIFRFQRSAIKEKLHEL